MNETNFARYARLIGLLVRETSGNCECDPEHPEQMVVVCRKTDGYRAKAVTAYDCGEEISIRSQQSHHTEELALEVYLPGRKIWTRQGLVFSAQSTQ